MTSDDPWSSNITVQSSGADSYDPALAASGAHVHALWSSDKIIYHAYLTDQVWSKPVRVASGVQAVLLAGADGALHGLFTNWFLGVSNIYYAKWDGMAWTLPEAVSRTPGTSTHPTLAVGPDGVLHAAWEDTTPGYATIYYGVRRANAWTAVPVPNGRGSFPALGVSRDGAIYLAWQDRLAATSKFEIFCAINHDGAWSTAENISDTAHKHSVYPQLALSNAGVAHLVWQEETEGLFEIQYADRQSGGWAPPTTLSTPGVDSRLGRIMTNRQGYCQALWAEGKQLRHRTRPPQADAPWHETETANSKCDGVSDLAVSLTDKGELHVLWSGYYSAEARRLCYLKREPLFKHTVFLPMIQG